MSEQKKYWAYFDEAWKQVLERIFFRFLHFLTPKLYEDIDISKSVSFLDKEMEQLFQVSIKGAKYVDKLAQVFLKDGSEQWILIHIEVQGEAEEDFSKRMFRYFYRIFDKYDRPIVSMAILTGKESIPEEGRFDSKVHGSGVEFRYLSFRLIDYDRKKLEEDDDPVALIILASIEREEHRRKGGRFDVKRYLIRKLRERNYSEELSEIIFRFIDWVIQLSEDEDELFWGEMREEVKDMEFTTSFERYCMRKGVQQGLQQMVSEALDEQFGEVPATISDEIREIKDQDTLRLLLRQAIRSKSIEEFQRVLNNGDL